MRNPRKGVIPLLAIVMLFVINNNQTISEATVRMILGSTPSAYMETKNVQYGSSLLPTTVRVRKTSLENDNFLTVPLAALDAQQLEEPYIEKGTKEKESQNFDTTENNVDDIDESVGDTVKDDKETEQQEIREVPQIPEDSETIHQPNQPEYHDFSDQENKKNNNSNSKGTNNSQSSQKNEEESDPISEPSESLNDENEREKNFQFSVSRNVTTQQFINKIGPDAQDVAFQYNLYASVMIAQAILETGSGNSALSSPPNHNLFGIKGSFRGQKVSFNTQEDDGSGAWYTISSNFRKYPSYRESIEDYAHLLKEGISGNSRFYAPVWKENAPTYRQATAWLTGRYATDIYYDRKLNALIEAYELTVFDNQPIESQTDQKVDVLQKEEKSAQNRSNEENQPVFKNLQINSANQRGSGNLPASIRTAKDRLQENANANTYANQFKGSEIADWKINE